MMKCLLLACLLIATVSAQIGDTDSGCNDMRTYLPCDASHFTFAVNYPNTGDCSTILKNGFKYCTFNNYAEHCHGDAFKFRYDPKSRRCEPIQTEEATRT